ncbi:hypothetical protein KGF54_003676 [Candida jiufengensis]|uniref:uncharacterized protein n=1 Tax=Candida jiufengensis TaxID=497108 RepID=UPI0022259B3D|nr:uncharacterized protein KGF54_003676 [Candida jiufengensis]KAI5952809.1 hypothetical protein KGF54_003676 [Candida jiufengensis]
MSSIPAWKRAGLSVNKTDNNNEDDLLETKRIDSTNLSNKEIKKVSNKRKLQDDLSHTKNKKPPKRIKLPKSERKPPPIKDQLVYLKTYQDDNSNWKFNKSKQNWILKNIKNIPQDFESALILYLGSLQGGSRDRLVEELKEDIQKWNTNYEEMERKIEKKLLHGDDSKEEKDKIDEEKEDKEDKRGLNLEYVTRCKAILQTLVDDEVIVQGLEEVDDNEAQEQIVPEKNEEIEDEEQDENRVEEIKVESEDLRKEEIKKDKKQKKDKKGKKDKKEQEEKDKKVDDKDKKDKKEKKTKKDKSEKKEKKTKKLKNGEVDKSPTSNLIINEIEV